jgi:tRNA A-37 threonylcarbamoyl transferase component Bud32
MLSHFVRKLRSFAPADVPPARAGGLLWHLTPAAVELFGDTGPSLDGHPGVVVKQNLQRTVSRMTLPGGVAYLKRCRANTPRAWVRELLRPPKARLEFENAVTLRERGVPCAEPLAWAETDSRWPGDSYVLTRECAGAVPFDEYLGERPGLSRPSDRQKLARDLGRLFAALHIAGVSHPDPHPGNFLFDGERFILLDVHAVRFGPPLTWPAARDNLVLFNRWFQVRGAAADRARFWAAYRIDRGWSAEAAAPKAREVEAATGASNLRFWATRTPRYLGTNRQFRRVTTGKVRGHAVRDLPDEVVQRWLADPDAVFTQPDVKLLKDSRSSTVAEGGGVVFKRFRLKSHLAAVKNLFRRSAALRSWVFGHNLLDRHLPTARPLFVAHRYRFGIPCEGYIAFETVPDAVALPDFVAAADRHELRQLADKLGRLIRLMHARHVSPRDLKAPNILLSGTAREPVLIDLVGLTVGKPVSDADRVQNLARLNASFVNSAIVSRTDRLRFLRAYLGGTSNWKSWWARVAAATGVKVLKNLQSGRPLA